MIKPKLDLSAHIAKLRKSKEVEDAASDSVVQDALVFWGESIDQKYLPQLKGCVGSATVFLRLETVTTLTTVQMYCNAKKVTKVISSSVSLLMKLLDWDKRAKPKLSNYAGSYFKMPAFKEGGADIEVVFIAPLKQLVTIPYAKFVATRMVSKLTDPTKWYKPTVFTGFDVMTASNELDLFQDFLGASLICIDIETFRENATIRCLSYTAFYLDNHTSKTVVLPLDSEYNLAIMRKWNWQLQAPKIFQNGKYDVAYLCRYSAPVFNWLFDTAHLFHSWYSELPKDLGFLNAFFVREAVYWKDLSETNDLHEYYRYNGLDTWGTGNAWIAMLLEAPQWAIHNYLEEFPLVFPCHLSEMTGIARDMTKFEVARAEQQDIVDTLSAKLNAILGVDEGTSFNVKSSPNMKALFKVLGCGDLKSQDEKNLNKARFRHPFNAKVLGLVLKIRKARTLVSNYLTAGKEFSRFDGTGSRTLYSLNPQGTDSGRLASKEHHFWCGDNIQKIPRGPIVKQTYKADPGFVLCEVDLEQAESRDTAYISGDPTLIENVENSPDFHCSNASSFFGVPFEEMFDIATGKVLRKDLRTLGKPVNHGANYNMGAYVLIDTMGEENIVKAKHLLKLNKFWGYVEVAEYLLEQFHKTYPFIRQVFYAGVIKEIGLTKMLSSTAVHGHWSETPELHLLVAQKLEEYEDNLGKAHSRYCFADPSSNKPALNKYIAHPPQNLNAMTLNRSYMSCFKDIAMNPKHSRDFKLLAQVHDSILFQYRDGKHYLADMVVERMEVPVTIRAYDGVVRTFVVPAGAKRGLHLPQQKAIYWSETE